MTSSPRELAARLVENLAAGDFARQLRLRPIAERLRSADDALSIRLFADDHVETLAADAPLQIVAPTIIPGHELAAARAFHHLHNLRRADFADSFVGKLALIADLSGDRAALPLAATMSGAAALALDASDERLRALMRLGWVDIVVNSVDEALRILKLSLRKGENIAIGLYVEPNVALRNFVERGLLPDLLLSGDTSSECSRLVERGSRRVDVLAPVVDRQALALVVADGRRATLQAGEDALLSTANEDEELSAWIESARLRLRPRALPARPYLLRSKDLSSARDAAAESFILIESAPPAHARLVAQAVDEQGRILETAYLLSE